MIRAGPVCGGSVPPSSLRLYVPTERLVPCDLLKTEVIEALRGDRFG